VQRSFTIAKRDVSFFYFDSDGKDEHNLLRDGLIRYVILERTKNNGKLTSTSIVFSNATMT